MSSQISQTQAFAFSELLEILSHMEEQYVQKIPQKLMDVFENNASTEYINHLDVSIPLEEQQVSEETSALLAILMLNYWYDSEEDKQKLLKICDENEKKYQEKLKEKYNPNNIFNSNQKTNMFTENIENQTTVSEPWQLPIDYNSFSWYKKLFTKVRNFIYKLFKKTI